MIEPPLLILPPSSFSSLDTSIAQLIVAETKKYEFRNILKAQHGSYSPLPSPRFLFFLPFLLPSFLLYSLPPLLPLSPSNKTNIEMA